MTHHHPKRWAAMIASGAAAATAALGFAASAQAATTTYNVTRFDDITTTCTPSDCSLRGAVLAANTDGTDSVINLPSGTYRPDLSATGSVLSIAADGTLTINGLGGAANTVIDGGGTADATNTYENKDRIFELQANSDQAATATIQGLTITGGSYDGNGGAIAVDGSNGMAANLTLNDDNLSGNEAGDNGGAIESNGILAVNRSAFSNNFAETDGAAIHDLTSSDCQVAPASVRATFARTTTLSIVNSTFNQNSADSNVGGLGQGAITLNGCDRSGVIDNSTIAGNTDLDGQSEQTTDANGGTRASGGLSVKNQATLDVVNSIVTGNTDHQSSQIRSLKSGEAPKNTASSVGPAVPQDCSGPVTSGGHNIESTTTCGFTGTGDQQNTDPKLDSLKLNAPGSTPTMALLSGSPAIDTADSANCPATDQRGVSRPQGPACDIGAFELEVAKPVPPPAPAAKPPAPLLPPPLTQNAPARPSPRLHVASSGVCSANANTVRISAANLTPLKTVKVYLDGKRIYTSGRASFKLSIRLSRLGIGSHKLVTVATDKSGRTVRLTRTILRCAGAKTQPRFTG